MTQRRYTLDEIDALRGEIRNRNMTSYPPVSYIGSVGVPMQVTEQSRIAIDAWERMCEDQLRTAMAGGAEPPLAHGEKTNETKP